MSSSSIATKHASLDGVWAISAVLTSFHAGEEGLTCAKDVARYKERPDHEKTVDNVSLALALPQREQKPAHVHERRAELPHQECRTYKDRAP